MKKHDKEELRTLVINFHNFGISHSNLVQLEKKLDQAFFSVIL